MTNFMKFPEADVTFNFSHEEEVSFHQNDLIQLFPYGLSFNNDGVRPFLLLKDLKGQHTLPVALNPLEAGVTLNQVNKAVAPSTPHQFTSLLMKSLGITAQQCVFVQIKGVHQYVRIYLQGHVETNSIKLRADEAMSLCLHLSIPIFATHEFINHSKMMTAEIQGINEEFSRNRQLLIKNHPYVM